MADLPGSAAGRWLNLVVPGGGLIWTGAAISGMVVGVAFLLALNLMIAATLLFPDDFAPWLRALLIGMTGGFYVGAQLRFAQRLRDHRHRCEEADRRAILQQVTEHLQHGRPEEALALLQPLSQRHPHDLLVTLRLAQVFTAAGNTHAARAAWGRLQSLDRHGIYRDRIRQQLRQLDARAHR